MKYRDTDDRVEISTDGTDGPYIVVDHDRLEEVHALLNANHIPHAIDPDAIEQNDQPAMGVVNLSPDVETDRIQRILDAVE